MTERIHIGYTESQSSNSECLLLDLQLVSVMGNNQLVPQHLLSPSNNYFQTAIYKQCT